MHCTSLHKEKALFFSFFFYFVWYITSVQKRDLSFFKLCTLYRKGKALFFLSSFYIFYGTYYPGPGPKAGLEFFLILCTSYCKGKALVFWGYFSYTLCGTLPRSKSGTWASFSWPWESWRCWSGPDGSERTSLWENRAPAACWGTRRFPSRTRSWAGRG